MTWESEGVGAYLELLIRPRGVRRRSQGQSLQRGRRAEGRGVEGVLQIIPLKLFQCRVAHRPLDTLPHHHKRGRTLTCWSLGVSAGWHGPHTKGTHCPLSGISFCPTTQNHTPIIVRCVCLLCELTPHASFGQPRLECLPQQVRNWSYGFSAHQQCASLALCVCVCVCVCVCACVCACVCVCVCACAHMCLVTELTWSASPAPYGHYGA